MTQPAPEPRLSLPSTHQSPRLGGVDVVGRSADPNTVAQPPSGHVFSPTLTPSGSAADAPVPLPEVPGYVVETALGRGATGIVYRAYEVALKRTVALKMLVGGRLAEPGAAARFRADAEAAARLAHPNVVRVYAIGEAEGVPFFSLEFCPGGALAMRLDGTPRPPAQAAEWAATLARAAHAAHEQGVVHRDLKPANVLIAADGALKVADFGLAKLLDEPVGNTASGMVLGTPSYMSPEQAAGSSHRVGPAADVYAVGAILYEFLTGRPPFKAATPLDTIVLVATEEPVPPRRLLPRLPADLETVCLKCLAKDPARRYATAASLADDLDRFRRHEPVLARRPSLPYRAVKAARRHRSTLAVAGGVALACGLLVVAGVGYQRRERARAVDELCADAREALARADAALDADADRHYDAAQQAYAAARAVAASPAARDGMAEVYARRCRRALARGDVGAAQALLLPVREWASADVIAALEAEIAGTARWRLAGVPAGFTVRIDRAGPDRRPERLGTLGRTPLSEQEAAPGDYVLTLSHPDHEELALPLRLGRGEVREVAAAPLLRGRTPAGMVYVPGGPYLAGDPFAGPLRRVDVPGFFMDRSEVTGADYAAFVRATGASPPDRWLGERTCPPTELDAAAVNVSFFDALEYAWWAGKRLPTEDEWEKAARGVDGRAFPWGNAFDRRRCMFRGSANRGLAVRRFGTGVSPYGLHDAAGNAWEWTLGREQPGSADRVIRGGAASSTPESLLTFRRTFAPPGGSRFGGLNLLGFRCARDLVPGPPPASHLDLLQASSDLAEAATYYASLDGVAGGRDPWALVRECVRRMLALNPRSVPGNFWSGVVRRRDGDRAGAAAALAVAFCQEPLYAAHDLKVERLLFGPDGVAAASDREVRAVPARLKAALEARAANDNARAESLAARVLDADAGNALACEIMSEVCAATGRAAEAQAYRGRRVASYRAEVREAPDDAGLAFRFGEFLFNGSGDRAEALRLVRRAVELAPQAVEYRLRLAGELEADGDWAAAEAVVRRGVELDPASDELRAKQRVYVGRRGRQ